MLGCKNLKCSQSTFLSSVVIFVNIVRFPPVRYCQISPAIAETALYLRWQRYKQKRERMSRKQTSGKFFSRATKRVLACSHSRSLQLLCTAGGNQSKLDARTEFKILERSPKGGGEAGRAHHCICMCN